MGAEIQHVATTTWEHSMLVMVLIPYLGLLTSTLVYRLQYQHGEGLV